MRPTSATSPYIQATLRPTARELRWFAQIDRHGPQSSEFLYECTRDTHRCRDTALRRLQALREAGYLRLPPQQRQIAKADFNPFVYDLTKLGWELLADNQDLERQYRPTGHWWHGYWVSAVSSAIDISAVRMGLTYIPAAKILSIRGADIAIPVGRHKLIPDQVFAIKYPEGYRAFALEVDRGTEPIRSKAARKSLQRSIEQYVQVVGDQLYRHHYGLKCNLAVVWIFLNNRRRQKFEEQLYQYSRAFRSQSIDSIIPRWSMIRPASLLICQDV